MKIDEIADICDDGTARLKEEYELTIEVAKVLAVHDGPVEVCEISRMPEEFAEIIVQHNGKGLQFNHSNADGPILSDKAAEILSRYKSDLTINDLPKLNYGDLGDEVAIAKALGKHKGGELYLNGLSELSTEAAKELLKHEKPVYLECMIDDNLLSSEALSIYQEAESRWNRV
jgi:hypothetical protein